MLFSKIRHYHFFFWIFIILQTNKLCAQDSLYFQPINNKFIIKPNTVLQSYKLNIHNKSFLLAYKPSNSLNIGSYFSYKKIGLGIGYNLLNQDESILDKKTTFYDIRLNYFSRHLALNLYYDYYKGFSINELPEEFSNDNKIEKIQPNLKLISVGINTLYAFSKKNSFKAIYNDAEIQKKSTGSFILGISQFYTLLFSKKTIIPDAIAEKYKIPIRSNFGKFYTILPNIGYNYTFVKNAFYSNIMFAVGGGTQWQRYKIAKIKQNDFNWAYKYYSVLKIGYNTPHWFYGASFSLDNNTAFINNAYLNFKYKQMIFFVGYRWL